MRYLVRIARGAVEDALEAREYIAQDSVRAADRWYEGLMAAIDSLSVHPRRCARAPESREFSVEVRHLLYKSHRVLFTVEGGEVHVHHVRHGARRPLRPG